MTTQNPFKYFKSALHRFMLLSHFETCYALSDNTRQRVMRVRDESEQAVAALMSWVA